MSDWPTKLYNASIYGNLNDVKEAARHVSIDAIALSKSDSFLSEATKAGHKQVVEYLITQNANVNKIGRNGKTPIFFAVSNGRLEIAKLLISKGANLNLSDKGGDTPLSCSIKSNRYDIAKLLLDNGANVNRIPFTEVELVGRDIGPGKTALSWAVSCNNMGMIQLLLNFGAQFTIHTAFLEAINCRNFEIVKFLKERGALVNAEEINGYTPLIKAVEVEYFEIVKFLVEHGANVNQKDSKGRTPLSVAALNNDLRTFDFLVQRGADKSVAIQELKRYKSSMDFAFYLDSLSKDVVNNKNDTFSVATDLEGPGHEETPNS